MANTKKYVSLDKLSLYDEKIKKVIADDDAAALASAKEYAESLGVNYDQAGAAATVQGKLDEEVIRAKAREDEVAAAAAAAQTDVDNLEKYVGTLPEGTAATSVVDYVNVKTAGIATDAALGELNNQVSGMQTVLNGIVADHLKAADKQELTDAIAAEAARADAAEKKNAADIKAIADDYLKAADAEALQADIDAIEADYLKAADKAELANAIALKADKTALDAVSAVANAAATQTALQGEIDRAKGEEARIEGLVTAEAERAAQAEAGLQTQINTIMNNPDTEGVINSINEFTQYIADHGEIAEGFRADIDANKKAIEDHETLAAQTYETKEDATAKYNEVKDAIAAIPQADWNQNDPDAADYVKNRPFYVVSSENINETREMQRTGPMGTFLYDAEFAELLWLNRKTAKYTIHYMVNNTYASDECVYECDSDYSGYENGWLVKSTTNDYMWSFGQSGDMIALGDYMNNDTGVNHSGATITVEGLTEDIVKLDEKFIPDTVARVADVDAAVTEIGDGLISAWQVINKKADASALTSAVDTLEAADAGIIERIEAVEAQLGDGEGSVTDLIADAVAGLQAEMATAIEGAKTDASNKDAVVLAEAQNAVAAVQTALDTHANTADIHVTAADKVKWNAAADVTSKAHEHSNLEVLEGINADKVAAWDAAEGNAKTYADGLNTAMNTRVVALEAWHENFVECSQEDINSLFA